MEPRVEAKYNPFDAPVPGQSLTDTPGNAPWEHPPQMTNIHEISLFLFKRLTAPRAAEQIILMLQEGVPAEALARVVLFGGFTEGKWTPDVAFIIAEPVMKMIVAVGVQGGVKKFRMSLGDMTNKNELKSIMDIKKNSEAFKKAAAGATETLPQPEQKGGLMAAPIKEEAV